MKKWLTVILCALLVCAGGCSAAADEVLDSLGKYQSEVYYSNGGFQDFTDYAKYSYDAVNLHDNPYFDKLSAESKERLVEHIEDFEDWIEAIKDSNPESEVVAGYDFDLSLISEADYVYIYDDPDYPELGNYDVYFFDAETMTLYYFHNNI